MNNVNIPASRAPLFARSPFLEFQAIVPEPNARMMINAAPEDKRPILEATVRASVDYAAKAGHLCTKHMLVLSNDMIKITPFLLKWAISLMPG